MRLLTILALGLQIIAPHAANAYDAYPELVAGLTSSPFYAYAAIIPLAIGVAYMFRRKYDIALPAIAGSIVMVMSYFVSQ